ncbi:anti-sigma-D factor RsdA [Micromonospora sp. URMC 105]|uniref:anti-sigma-D factor RsdA n=1 Tax=Micromonospora sp. URMC 105 TaxID=3423413 RepID=UPI003F1978EE
MSRHEPDGGEELDLTTVTRDDLLLDALGRGEEGADGDELAAMLAAWRADVTADADDTGLSAPLLAVGTSAGRPGGRVGADLRSGPADVLAGRVRPRRPRPWALRLAAAVAAVLVLATGLGVGSRNAGPTSPLWSLTKVLHPEQAAVRTVEQSIARARDAVAAGRLDEARHWIDQARQDLAWVADPAGADRLRAEIDALLRELATPRCPGSPGCAPPPAPAPAASTGGGSPGASAPAAPPSAPASPSARPTPRSSSGSGLLPSLPKPSAPKPPLPTGPAPSSSLLPPLPGLPLPTGGLLD